MKTYSRFVVGLLVLLSVVVSSCSALSPDAMTLSGQVEEQEVVRNYDMADEPEGVYYESAQEPLPPMPTASATNNSDAGGGPSTGGSAEPNDQPYGDVFFEDYGANPRIDTEDDHFSTFAVDVDTASYTVMRRYVNDGFLPADESVRVEEYVNFFDYNYAPPESGAFAIHLEGSPSPYTENYHLVRVGLQGYEIPPEERKDVVLTFVIDVSGSMDMENRLELVKDALAMLVEELRPTDKVGIVVYGSQAHTILEHTSVGDNYRRIFKAIDNLEPEGSTNAEEGLVLAYRLASREFDPDAINRVILCSDGVANVGSTGPDSILKQIREYAADDIYLTTVGFGMGNYNDTLMEQLANDGNGFYTYVDTLKEAERVFVHDLTSTLQVIAKDAKIQVDFNPSVISRYRLLGYENRDVADEDFRNDDVDAGEIGVGHSVTALYEVKLQKDAPAHQPAMTVYVRYEAPEFGEVVEINKAIAVADFAGEFEQTSHSFQLSVIVAQYAEILRGSYWAKDAGTELSDIALDARRIAEYFPNDEDVQEFSHLVELSQSLSETR
ncbi:MAG: von Willebrand factor type A domain-containing protein [Anaerolineae bacterium]|nr:von Willebrand factor type A domain-containing protein [Anaerolineae bacterium]